jgi:hypothetical protein
MQKKSTSQQIGRAGELLVQFKLLRFGIESAALTTDAGIDLVAYSPLKDNAITIQVKANEKAKPGGGAGSLALDWWLRENSPAELVALADLESQEVWLFTHSEFAESAQQHSNGRYHFYMYLSDTVNTKKKALMSQFEAFRLENRVRHLL